MNKNELKPCPFCGAKCEVVKDHTAEGVDWIRHIENKGDCGLDEFSTFSTTHCDVSKAWNARPTPNAAGLEGYKNAFYEIGKLLNIPAQPIPPKQVFEEQMLPRLKASLQSGWVPIETAPEREQILVGGYMQDGSFECFGVGINCGYGIEQDNRVESTDMGYVVWDGSTPTHWMPLPQPPQKESD